ncbi:hypothetical protein OIE62_07740 [Streptomyces scopuliridis]|uniref:Uncharacterized protein n=1 Tax=Streptomyces scopuliridis TaxID=452529 RepID=A0ACD4ZUQ5_9ACTN|nr:hypothetical protein [Streptomyces scopuliridis]WSC01542.1 hypothetical protein OG835_34080 [Streptomyces scopuliridis]WSC04920.1 hypothetical protein OIE62_07740 [Streptomyces scopuliridis]
MTTPPADGLLFEVPAPPTPVERLLRLADQYVRHNDKLDLLLRSGSEPEPDAHVASAQQLASATRTAIKAITDERLYESPELSDAVVRLQQLAYLSSASTDHRLPMARTLTALAPEAAVDCATSVAAEIRHRRWTATGVPDQQLTATQHTALWEIARGHVVTTSSLGRQYVHYRDARVLISTLRSLEAKDLAERVPKSASSAYTRGPLQDRVRLTSAGTTALASAIGLPPATRAAPGTTPPSRLASAAAQREDQRLIDRALAGPGITTTSSTAARTAVNAPCPSPATRAAAPGTR